MIILYAISAILIWFTLLLILSGVAYFPGVIASIICDDFTGGIVSGLICVMLMYGVDINKTTGKIVKKFKGYVEGGNSVEH